MCAAKLALGNVDNQTVFLEALEQKSQVVCVSFWVFACYQDVINVNKCKVQTLEDAVHQALKGLCSIFQPKGHSEEFKQTKRCDYGCSGDVLVSDWDLVIASNKVNL